MRTRYSRHKAILVADELVEILTPYCVRIIIAGSLRRGAEEVGDVEILYIPRMENRPDGLFGTRAASLADERIDCILNEGILAKRPSVTGGYSWGEKNKLAVHLANGIPVDLFSSTVENWWVSLVVRTGGKETNLRLTTGAQKLNRSLNAYGCGVTNEDGTVTPAMSEEHVFELCGVPYATPENRP